VNNIPHHVSRFAFHVYVSRSEMSPRLTDWSLAAAAGIAFGSGVISLISGHPEQWLIFAVHGIAGLWLLLLLWGKLRRVWPRLLRPRRWDRRTLFSAAALLAVALAGGSGIWWVAGGDLFVAGFNLMNWHIALGLALTLAIAAHMFARAKPLRKRDVRGRRELLRFGALLLGGVALWPAQQAIDRALGLAGAGRRFSGSREAGSYAGNAFPATSWVADRPRPIDAQRWRLRIDGAVATALELGYDDLVGAGDVLEATLDCTGGFYSTQIWRGAQVGRLIERAGALPDAGWVRFISVTGYRWSLPLGEACAALLATHVGGEPLSHEHGAPARLVAPGRRGFEWVKWLARIELAAAPDPEQTLSLFTSSFTPAGRGES
jgi:DMSO/TMAO reductase YedYZ molybdopterin-dependent catalytic subunit